MVPQIFSVWRKQRTIISNWGLKKIVELESRAIWITAKIEMAGFEIDAVKMIELQESNSKILKKVKNELLKYLPDDIDTIGDSNLKAYLNRTFRWNLTDTTKENLSSLIGTVKNTKVEKLLKLILEYRALRNENSEIDRYLNLANNGDYRVRGDIDQINTVSGRLYHPLQGVNRGPLRSFFIAKKGYKLVLADYSQQEARIIAALADDKNCLDIFKSGKDLYLEVAKLITGRPADECGDFRKIAKLIVLGLNNGMTEYSILGEIAKTGFNASLDDVRAFINTYYQSFPNLVKWRNQTVLDAETKSYVTTRLGRRMIVSNDTGFNSICNFPVQGTGADGFKLALIDLDDKLKALDARIVHILHDEIIVEAREDIADRVASILKESMETAFRKLIPELPFVVEPVISDAWG